MNNDLEQSIAKLENLALRIFRSCADENVKPNYIHWSDGSYLMLLVDELRELNHSKESAQRGLTQALLKGK